MFDELKNWGRWGADDERGTLQLITAEQRIGAAALVETGLTVSLAHDLLDPRDRPCGTGFGHEMLASGVDLGAEGLPGYQATRDSVKAHVHGLGLTHLDALCHMFVRGRMYNGYGPDLVSERGAERNSVMTCADGVAGRGVLLDVPASLGIDYLEASHRITVAELEAAEARQGVHVAGGDLLIVATGLDARAKALEGVLDPFTAGLAGMHPQCLPWLADRGVGLLGSDGISDAMPPSPIENWPFPIHQVAITGLGLIMVDNLRLDSLLGICEQLGRWVFLLTISPLRVRGGTGSPVNPIALF